MGKKRTRAAVARPWGGHQNLSRLECECLHILSEELLLFRRWLSRNSGRAGLLNKLSPKSSHTQGRASHIDSKRKWTRFMLQRYVRNYIPKGRNHPFFEVKRAEIDDASKKKRRDVAKKKWMLIIRICQCRQGLWLYPSGKNFNHETFFHKENHLLFLPSLLGRACNAQISISRRQQDRALPALMMIV